MLITLGYTNTTKKKIPQQYLTITQKTQFCKTITSLIVPYKLTGKQSDQ